MADTKISAETAASALTGAEIVPVVQGGANRRTTAQDIADLGGGGAMTLIGTVAANNTADNIAFTGLTGDRYLLVIENLVPATAGADLIVQLGEGGTPTYQTSGYAYVYTYTGIDVVDGGVTRAITASNLGPMLASSGSAGIPHGRVHLNGLSQAKRHAADFVFVLHANGNGKYYDTRGSGVFLTDTTAITAIRIITSAGNIASGNVSLYLLG